LRHSTVFSFQPASTTNVYSAAALFLCSAVLAQRQRSCLAAARLFNRDAVVGLCRYLSAAALLLSKGALVVQQWLGSSSVVQLLRCCWNDIVVQPRGLHAAVGLSVTSGAVIQQPGSF
jgi:hypothetical protein